MQAVTSGQINEGDVVSIDVDDTMTPAPDETDGDIRRTVVRHTARTVQVTVSFVELRRTDETVGHFFSFVTDDGVRRDVTLVAYRGKRQGELEMMTRTGRTVECDGMQRAIDYAAGTVRLVVPRSCLKAPRWVRAGMGTYRFDSATELGHVLVDDAHRNGSIGRSHPAWGDRVRRG